MKKSVFRLSLLSLALCMILSYIPVKAYGTPQMEYPKLYGSAAQLPGDTLSLYTDTEELRSYLTNELKSCPARVYVSQFSIPASAETDLRDFIWREIPEAFHVYGIATYKTGIVTSLTFSYRYTAEEYETMLDECAAAADRLLNGIEENADLTDAEKALLIHDRLAETCDYSYDSSQSDRYIMYAALVKGHAVCDGYTKAYAYLLNRVGIKNANCSSDTLNHAWNLVMIDGKYYHVDVTWDDKSWKVGERGVLGYISHDNFLRSNTGIKAVKHTSDDYPTPANDTKYDSFFWQDSYTAFQLVSGDIYYINGKKGTLERIDDAENEIVADVSDIWYAGSGMYWDGNFARLCTDGYSLFYNTADKIFIYEPGKNVCKEIFAPELEEYDAVYGLSYSEGIITADINNCPVGSTERLRQVTFVYIPEMITVELNFDLDLKDVHTLYADIISDTGVSGYYFGKNASFSLSDMIGTNETSLEFTVSEPGTYYFAASDGKGEISETVSITFCLIRLHPNGGSLKYENILSVKGMVFDLPVPQREGVVFAGWSETEGAETGETEYEISDPPEVSDYYACWKEKLDVTVTVSVPSHISVFDAEGKIIGQISAEPGEHVISVTDDAGMIVIGAPGRISVVYAGNFTDGLKISGALRLKGDVNSDGNTNNKDVSALFRFVSGTGWFEPDPYCSDCNADGNINNKDISILFRYVSGTVQELPDQTELIEVM